MILAVWILTGLLSFCGTLALAELGAMLPATGGQYVYLREAYGPLWAFLYGWTTFFVIWTGGTAGIAAGFSIYLSYFVPLAPRLRRIVAAALVLALTAVNYRGVRLGAAVQNLFTALKMAGLLILIASAFLARPAREPESWLLAAGFSWTGFGAAMAACLFAYEGWNAVSFVAGEIRAPQRNLPLGLALGMGVTIAVYALANAAFLRTLPVAEIAAAERVGAAVAERTIGPLGAALVSLTILVSIVGSANGCILSGPRVYFAQARDGLFFARFTRIHPRFETPDFSILAQGALTAVFALTGSFELLISYSVFGSWVFYVLTAAAVLVLRRKRPELPRPYRMWGYPVTPLLFCAAALGFLLSSFAATPQASLMGLLLIAAGVPFYYLWRRHKGAAAEA
jgi:APA family basic amino acid/polyamine antiporter